MAERTIKIIVTLSGEGAARAAEQAEARIKKSFEDTGATVETTGKKFKESTDIMRRSFDLTGTASITAGQLIADGVRTGISAMKQFAESSLAAGLEYQKASATVKNLGADMDAVQAGIKNIDATYADSTTLLNTYFKIHSGGVTDTREALDLLGNSAALAYGEAAELNDVAAAGIKVWNVYGEEFKRMGQTSTQALEQISYIAKLGDTDLQRVAASLPTVLQTSYSLGISFAETGAAAALMTQKFKSTEQSTQYLDAMLRSVTMQTEQAAKAAKELDFDWNADHLVKSGLTGYLQELAAALERSGKSKGEIAEILQQLTGSAEASRGLQALLQSLEQMPGYIEEIANSGGRIKEVADNMKEARGEADFFTNTIKNLQIEIGNQLQPKLNQTLPAMVAAGQGFSAAAGWALDFASGIAAAGEGLARFWATDLKNRKEGAQSLADQHMQFAVLDADALAWQKRMRERYAMQDGWVERVRAEGTNLLDLRDQVDLLTRAKFMLSKAEKELIEDYRKLAHEQGLATSGLWLAIAAQKAMLPWVEDVMEKERNRARTTEEQRQATEALAKAQEQAGADEFKRAKALHDRYKPLSAQIQDVYDQYAEGYALLKQFYGDMPGWMRIEEEHFRRREQEIRQLTTFEGFMPDRELHEKTMASLHDLVNEKLQRLIETRARAFDDLGQLIDRYGDYEMRLAAINNEYDNERRRVLALNAINVQKSVLDTLLLGVERERAEAIRQLTEEMLKLTEGERRIVNAMADAADRMRDFADLADLVGSRWADALDKVATGLENAAAAAASFATGNWLTGIMQGAAAVSSLYSGLFGREGLFGSGQYDDSHAAGWMANLGVNNADILNQIQARIETLRNAGMDKFDARTVAEMESIPALIEFLDKIDQSQADQMLWKISHAIETLGYGTDAWRAAFEPILTILEQVDAGNVAFTQHTAELVSGLTRHGMLTDEVFEKIRKHASDDHLRAWMSETAAGTREGTVSLGEFTRALGLLYSEATTRGIEVEGQLIEMLTAAKEAGWSLADVGAAIENQMDLYRDAIRDLRGELAGLRADARGLREDIAGWQWDLFKWQMFELPKAQGDLAAQFAGSGWGYTRARDITETISTGPNSQATVMLAQAGQWTGAEAWEQLQESIKALTAGFTEAMTPQEMMELVRSVSPDAQQAVANYLELVQHGIKLTEQIAAAREQILALKDSRREIKEAINSYKDRISDIRQSLNFVENRWHQIPDRIGRTNDLLGDLLDEIRAGIRTKPMAGGGLISGQQLYTLAEQGPEFVMNNAALGRYGVDMLEAMNSGTYQPPVALAPIPVPVSAPLRRGDSARAESTAQPIVINLPDGRRVEMTATISEDRIRRVVVDEIRYGREPIPASRVDQNR